MTKRNLLFALLLSYSLFAACQKSDQEKYIDRWSDIAIQEMERSGVPASIKLAQGLLESGSGKSTLAQKANNHFGIKCGGRWNGRTYYHKDDDYENGQLVKSCFRAYRSAEASFKAHSDFLRDQNKTRYNFLFDLDPRDYKGWAHGLKKAGYATSKRYAYGLINVIETYDLTRFDRMSSGSNQNNNPGNNNNPLTDRILRINDVKMVLASNKDTPAKLAQKYNVSLKRLMKYNEKITSPSQKLKAEERVYLQCKRKHWRGKEKYHYTKKGETMFDIAQKYGLRLDKLYRKNRMEVGTEPVTRSKIKIRGWRVKKKNSPKTTRKKITKEEEYLFEDDEQFNNNDGNSPPKKKDDNAVYHTVRPGQTLYGIAKEYRTTVKLIKELNNLTNNTIYKGQKIRVK